MYRWGLWECISLAGYEYVEAVGDRSYNQSYYNSDPWVHKGCVPSFTAIHIGVVKTLTKSKNLFKGLVRVFSRQRKQTCLKQPERSRRFISADQICALNHPVQYKRVAFSNQLWHSKSQSKDLRVMCCTVLLETPAEAFWVSCHYLIETVAQSHSVCISISKN